jgi:methionyl-tRNA formyltransferase
MTYLEDVLLVAAHSARSQAYVQTLGAHGLMPSHALLLGDAPSETIAANGNAENLLGVLLPDLGIPVTQSLADAGVPCIALATRDINAAEVLEAVRRLAPRLIIFSGYGGQIVKPPLIELGIPLLHIHSGWLPDYRGSTTVYYSLLEERSCAASAILLDTRIDTGPVLARKSYPAPPRGTDIDRRYDTAIRADLLLEVIRSYQANGKLSIEKQQHLEEGNTYYVIHPVLKHLALLSLPAE